MITINPQRFIDDNYAAQVFLGKCRVTYTTSNGAKIVEVAEIAKLDGCDYWVFPTSNRLGVLCFDAQLTVEVNHV